MKHANYRKINDRSHNGSKYHKLDSANIRAILKEENRKHVADEIININITINQQQIP